MGIANSFSGGIFLSAGLLHMLPEADEKLKIGLGIAHKQHKDIFPYTYLAGICSFSLILFIDKILFSHSHSHGHNQYDLMEDRQSSFSKQPHLEGVPYIDSKKHQEEPGKPEEKRDS